LNLTTRMILVLTSVGILSGGFLASVGSLTKKPIAMNNLKGVQDAILQVVPDTVESEKLFEEEDFTVYGSKDNGGRIIGYAVYTSGTGFQDVITLMYGTDVSVSKISRMVIIDQAETPGLGAKITEKETFLQFWENRDASEPLTLRKPAVDSPAELSASEVNTITGATISSEKVLETVNLSLEKLKSLKNKGELGRED